MLEKDFYTKVEQKNYLKHTLYSDTDSTFNAIPLNNQNYDLNEKWKLVLDVTKKINILINNETSKMLTRVNINPSNNYTFFKPELLIDGIMLLDVKKNYAYKKLSDDGNILKTPKVIYKGIKVVRSDVSKITQYLLKTMIENVMLNKQIPANKKEDKLIEIINDTYNNFTQNIKNFEFNEIGFPVKWNKQKQNINGMLVYNYILKQKIFSMGSSALLLPCTFQSLSKFQKISEQIKSNVICIPFSFDKMQLKNLFIENSIKIDERAFWKKIFVTACDRVYKIAKKLAE